MAQPYVGEIRMFAGNFAPLGWLFCQGQLLPIAENVTLFVLIGTTYGGDGQVTFALPDLRGRFPMHLGNGFTLGQPGGQATVALTAQQIPVHNHPANGAPGGDKPKPEGSFWSADPGGNTAAYNTADGSLNNPPTKGTMAAAAIGDGGGNQAHANRQPYLPINYIISLFGVFPSQG